jgi:heterodisulfide reductase subunit A
MLEAGRHPQIEILAYSEVKSVTGKAGDFRVEVLKKARYIREDICNACGECAQKCPSKVPDEFDLKLRDRKAIYIYFPQGIPAVYTIDRAHCLKFTKDICGVCEKICKKGAVNYEQQDQILSLSVGAIIVATGLESFNPIALTHYGYGRLKNVITGMEYERLINATGPTKGHLKRPSDGVLAKKVGYIQCVGSRDLRYNNYCSSICCMYAIKDAMLAKEHDEESESYIFHTDFRVVGKWFQNYKQRGEKDYGIHYIRGRVGEITQDEQENPIVWYEDTMTREVKSLKLDLVVLATGAIASPGVEQLAEILGIELDENRFFKTNPLFPTDTSKPGVYICGFCRGPADIPESVAQASAAAARAAEIALGRAA